LTQRFGIGRHSKGKYHSGFEEHHMIARVKLRSPHARRGVVMCSCETALLELREARRCRVRSISRDHRVELIHSKSTIQARVTAQSRVDSK
jgi:hypothetical protein